MRRYWAWGLLAVLVLVQIGYPLVSGDARAGFVVVTVALGFALSVGHAAVTRGRRAALGLVAVTCAGGLAVEALAVATCVPFGCYSYTSALGPQVLGVAWVIPLAWTWMAWPAWLVAGVLVRPALGSGSICAGVGGQRRPTLRPGLAPVAVRVAVAAWALASWDLFLDPQMVAEGYWTWEGSFRGLPGVPDVPVGNYLGWLLVALVMMVGLAFVAPAGTRHGEGVTRHGDGVMSALYLWTYCSSVLAHAVFLGLPWSALWGGVAMGVVAVPLGVRAWRSS